MTDKYTKWKGFILKVGNVLSTYNLQEMGKIAIVKNRLGKKGLHYIESLTEGEKETCGTLEGLVDTLAAKFRPQCNQTIKSLQYRQLHRIEGKGIDGEWGDYAWQWQNAAIERSIGNLKNNSFIA